MFKLFKKRSEIDTLYSKYEKLMNEANQLSKINRSKGDEKYFQADQILNKIKLIEKQS